MYRGSRCALLFGMNTPDPFKRTPDATTEQKQGAVGCFMIGAWLLALPIAFVLWLTFGPAAGIGALVGVAIVGWWASSKARGGSGAQGVPHPDMPGPDRQD